jgi:hypothetical protein
VILSILQNLISFSFVLFFIHSVCLRFSAELFLFVIFSTFSFVLVQLFFIYRLFFRSLRIHYLTLSLFNITNYVWWFKMMMQNVRKMIIYMSINNNLFILYFHFYFDAKFKQYHEHYVQIHEIMSNESNFVKNINYAINRFLNICVNRLISKKLKFVMIVIIFISNLFVNKIQLNAYLKIKHVVIIIIKMCIIYEKKISHDEWTLKAAQFQTKSWSI